MACFCTFLGSLSSLFMLFAISYFTFIHHTSGIAQNMARTRATATEDERRSVARKANQSRKKYADGSGKTIADPMDMSDRELLNALKGLGATVGPVNDGTRAVYQRRLGKLMKEKGLTHIDDIGPEVEQEEEMNNMKGKKNENVKRKTISQKKKEKTTELNKVMEEEEDEREEDEKEKGRVESQIDKVKIDEKQKGRRTKSKKVSFAQIDVKEKKTKDENEKTDEIQVQMKKRDPSVQIVNVRRNEIKDNSKDIRGIGMVNRTIVIEEKEEGETTVVTNSTLTFDREEIGDDYSIPNDGEEEEYDKVDEEEGERETSAVVNSSISFEEEEVGDTYLIPNDEEGDENEGEREYDKEDDEEEGEKETSAVASSTITFERKEIGDTHHIPSDSEEEEDGNEREVEYEEEDEIEEDSYHRVPLKIRPRFSVESHAESILRRSQMNREMSSSEEEDEEREEDGDGENDERRMTIDIFNRKSLPSPVQEGRKSAQPLPRKMSLILEESDDMDVSSESEGMMTMKDHEKENHPNDSDEMDISNGSKDENDSSLRMFRGISCRSFVDDSVNMNVSNRHRDDTLKLRLIDKNASILIVDTPKSSRMSIKKNDTSLYGPRNIRKMIGKGEEKEDTFRILQNRRLNEDLMSDSPNIPFPLEDTFMNYRRRYLDHSVGMDTFNNGIGNDGRNRMNSTRNSEANALWGLGKTFVAKDVENEQNKCVNDNTFVIPRNREKKVASDATFVVPRRKENTIHEREKSFRLTRNISRSPSRSPVRNRTYVVAHSPSRINSTRKSSIVSTPTRSRPPKPMPRRIKPVIECDIPSTSSSVVHSQLKPPVPAPRRIPPSVIGETRKSRLDGRNIVNEKKYDGISPASLFMTQPRLEEKKAQIERECTPIDRENIKKLVSLRDQMRLSKKVNQPVFELDTEARLIIEDAPHLKPFFY